MPVRRHPIAVSQDQGQLARVPLDVPLAERLKKSYELVRAKEVRFGEIFYAKLFDAAPGLRVMFKTDPAVQARKLMESLDAVVRNLEQPKENAAMLAELGKRHAGYGATPAHYELVVSLLIESMREVLGAEGEGRVLEEWRTALKLISQQMIAGGGGAVNKIGQE